MAQIYAIVNKLTNKCYVGCTKSGEKFLKKRFREHRCLLRAGKHAEKSLQKDWQIYGEHYFTVETLEELGECELETKRERELWWMSWFAAGEPPILYNSNRSSFAPTPEAINKSQPLATKAVGRKWSPEANEKRRQAQLGKPKGHGAKVSATKKALGQRPSIEAARAGGIAVHAKRKAAKLKI
jgi:group I intron endonuclease